MSNMSYCRFQNTLSDLQDCHENMNDGEMSDDELIARKRLVQLCIEIANNYEEIAEEPIDFDRNQDDGEPDDVELQHERAEERWRESAADRRYGMGA